MEIKSIVSKDSEAADEQQNLLKRPSEASDFKPPDFLITDYKFKPIEADEMKINPVLGVEQISNIYSIDWAALKKSTMVEWSSVC